MRGPYRNPLVLIGLGLARLGGWRPPVVIEAPSNDNLTSGGERPSPSDILPRTAISFDPTDNTLLIDLQKLVIPFIKKPRVWYPSIPDTGSMDPVYDAGHNVIYIQGAMPEDQQALINWLGDQPPGNIVVGGQPGSTDLGWVTHRVFKVGADEDGRTWQLKGDNSAIPDPYVLRDVDIHWVGIAVVY